MWCVFDLFCASCDNDFHDVLTYSLYKLCHFFPQPLSALLSLSSSLFVPLSHSLLPSPFFSLSARWECSIRTRHSLNVFHVFHCAIRKLICAGFSKTIVCFSEMNRHWSRRKLFIRYPKNGVHSFAIRSTTLFTVISNIYLGNGNKLSTSYWKCVYNIHALCTQKSFFFSLYFHFISKRPSWDLWSEFVRAWTHEKSKTMFNIVHIYVECKWKCLCTFRSMTCEED